MNPSDKISKYCSYGEAIHSDNAIRSGIQNIPNDEQLKAMIYVATEIFDKVREYLGEPLTASSFFRSAQLNGVTPGSSVTSQHTKGEAVDMFCAGRNAEVFWHIKNNPDEFDFDQLIYEFGTEQEPAWVHCSKVPYRKNRREVLRAFRGEDGVRYVHFDLKQ